MESEDACTIREQLDTPWFILYHSSVNNFQFLSFSGYPDCNYYIP